MHNILGVDDWLEKGKIRKVTVIFSHHMEFPLVLELSLDYFARFNKLKHTLKILLFGCGCGGDIVGCLPLYYRLISESHDVVLGSIVWERTENFTEIGPIKFDNISDLVSIPNVDSDVIAYCTSNSKRISDGLIFQAARVSKALNEKIVIININKGPKRIGECLDGLAKELGINLIICLDVGGDFIARGKEPGLESPLADAISLASCFLAETKSLLAIYGPNADGEISLSVLSQYFKEFLDAQLLLGKISHSNAVLNQVKRIIVENNITTEASMQPILVADGKFGYNPIRNGSRRVFLDNALCATYIFDLKNVFSFCPIANLILESDSIEQANNQILEKMNITTEFEFEKRKQCELIIQNSNSNLPLSNNSEKKEEN